MVREGLARRQGGEEDFRWRGEDVSRIEAFTLLVDMRGFFAFAICFALLFGNLAGGRMRAQGPQRGPTPTAKGRKEQSGPMIDAV